MMTKKELKEIDEDLKRDDTIVIEIDDVTAALFDWTRKRKHRKLWGIDKKQTYKARWLVFGETIAFALIPKEKGKDEA